MNPWVNLATLGALLVYAGTVAATGRARGKYSIAAPAVTGHEMFERTYRVQTNTLEGLVLFLPCLWLFAATISAPVAAGIGLVWIIGRILYAVGYVAAPAKRAAGFAIQGLATIALLLGALVGVVLTLLHH